MQRRTFLANSAAALAISGSTLSGASAQSASVDNIPIIDSHIHLFDGTRPVGAEYTGSRDYSPISKVSLPLMYAPQVAHLGISGAIVIQSSKWLEENLWYLEICNANPFMVGVCGWLDTGMADFGQYIERYHRDPLYRAIRFSSFYTGENEKVALNPSHIPNLKLLAQADIVLETQTPTINLMRANCLAADAIPTLRIIMDHLPSFDPNPANQKAYEAVVREMGKRPNIFVKLTEVYHPQRTPERLVVKDEAALQARLTFLYEIFGEDRVIFGTDYPNSYGVATLPEEVNLMKRFFAGKSREAAEKYFWKNSQRVYKWAKRIPGQPSLA